MKMFSACVALLVMLPVPAFADFDAGITDIVCLPGVVTDKIPSRKAGTAVGVKVNFDNTFCDETVDVTSLTVTIVGNAADTLGGTGIFGPVVRSTSVSIDCDDIASQTITASSALPASLAGTVAWIIVTANFKGQTSGLTDHDDASCQLNIVP